MYLDSVQAYLKWAVCQRRYLNGRSPLRMGKQGCQRFVNLGSPDKPIRAYRPHRHSHFRRIFLFLFQTRKSDRANDYRYETLARSR